MNAKTLGIGALLFVLCGYLSLSAPDAFLTPNNIENLLRRTAMYGVLGIGVAFVIITSGIDLSIGSVVCLSGCLLAVFLQVDYAPFDEHPILAVQANESRIVLRGEVDEFSSGERIRYYGGRRAHNAILSIKDVEQIDFTWEGAEFRATAINVEGKLSSNDDNGQIARVYEVKNIEATDNEETPAKVTLASPFDGLARRDQLSLVHPESGLKTAKIDSITESDDDVTEIVLSEALRGVDTQWLAIPLERRQTMSVPAALASVLGIGIGLGLIHGLLVTKLKLQPFVVTLCGLLIYRGLARWIVNDQPQGFGTEYAGSLAEVASGRVMLYESPAGEFGIPYPFFILLFVAIIAAVFLNKTIWGRYLMALGSNEAAARYSGINTQRVTIVAYVICCATAALGGMLFALDSNSVSPSSFGNFFELYAIAAAVLGGCSLRGGEGSILGVVIGTAVMQTLKNLIILLKISDTLEFAIIGGVILLGVIADESVRRYAARRRALSQAKQAG